MAKKRVIKRKQIGQARGSLDDLIDVADTSVLGQLVKQVVAGRPDVRRECVEFLQRKVAMPPNAKAGAEAEIVFALWDELEPALAELDEYGGGPRDIEYKVGDLLSEIAAKLDKTTIARDHRRALLDEVLPYIKSRNSGMVDSLYEVAYAACRDDEDLRDFAQRLEALAQDWPLDHARRIYRRIGDREKYLTVRSRRMKYGGDYHDLATFYWEQGDKDKALAVAREGMEKAEGRMDELHRFLADRAKESGDREGYLELQFRQATDRLTLASYKAFRKLCSAHEWKTYEPRIVVALKNARQNERLKVHMHRKEYDQAVAILAKMRYPDTRYGGGDLLKIAARLEKKYPDKILTFYRSGLGSLNQNAPRDTYARWAKRVEMLRHMWLDVLKKPDQWETFAGGIKKANLRRPALQEEFAKAIPDWERL